jgi:hypothetical protein
LSIAKSVDAVKAGATQHQGLTACAVGPQMLPPVARRRLGRRVGQPATPTSPTWQGPGRARRRPRYDERQPARRARRPPEEWRRPGWPSVARPPGPRRCR